MNAVSFDDFHQQWMEDVLDGNPSSIELGCRFAHKLFAQWRDLGEGSDDLMYCDGPGDGGIDLAYLERGEIDADHVVGDTWYLVQSKHRSSFQGTRSLLQEGQKILDSLSGGSGRLSGLSAEVIQRVRQFLSKADLWEVEIASCLFSRPNSLSTRAKDER